jgi:hypothetical protein
MLSAKYHFLVLPYPSVSAVGHIVLNVTHSFTYLMLVMLEKFFFLDGLFQAHIELIP